MKIDNFKDAKKVLDKYIPKRSTNNHTYTLSRMTKLMSFLGNPQNKLKVIHIAGTSGKSSTAYYAAALLTEAGYKTGLTVSPHITEINDRLQINMVPLHEKEYCAELCKFMDLIAKSKINPSYFEILIAFAFWEFNNRKVDYAVIEVGLGGLVDGTNVVNRKDKICIITDIGFDHTKVLGSSLSKIAFQKAGIIKDQNTVFCYRQDPEVNKVIEQVCQKNSAKLNTLNQYTDVKDIEGMPSFQKRNFSLALEAVSFTLDRDNFDALTDKQIIKAAKTFIPARLEIINFENKIVIIDGAHNAQKIHALASAVKEIYPNQEVALLLSFVKGGEDKLDDAMHELSKLSHSVILTSFKGKQDTPKSSRPVKDVVKAAENLNLDISIIENPELALGALLGRPERILVVTGSFYLLNHIRPLLLKT